MDKCDRKIDRRVRKSKNALKESLLLLMQSQEFRDISIMDIVQAADVNRGTFYKHYQYKEDVLEDLIDNVISDLIESYREPYKNSEIFSVSEITSSTIKIFDHVAKYSTFYTLVVKSNLPGIQNRICDELKKIYLEDLILCSPNDKMDNELYATYQAHAVFGIILHWIKDGVKYSPIYMAEQLHEIINYQLNKAIYRTNRKSN